MDLCPKINNIHCPLYDIHKCGVPSETCIFIKTFDSTNSNSKKINEMQEKFEALMESSKKIFAQFGIRF